MTNPKISIDYMKTYTDLCTGKIDFHGFMEIIESVYEYVYAKGQIVAIGKFKDILRLE